MRQRILLDVKRRARFDTRERLAATIALFVVVIVLALYVITTGTW